MGELVEGRWDCRECGARGILGRHRSCTACASPRGKVKFYFDDVGSLPVVTSAAQVAEALAGPDWFCDVCGGANSARGTACMHCGDPRTAADERPARFAGVSSGASSGVAPGDGEYTLPRRTRRFTTRVAIASAVACVLANLVLWWIWSMQEHEVIGEVASTEWTHQTVRETYVEVTRRDWASGLSESAPVMPVNGRGERGGVQNIRNCREEIHHYETYACGTERVCETKSRSVACGTEQSCSVVDHGNGYGSRECSTVTRYCSESYTECRDETKYCERPVYATKCDYDTWQWQTTETKTVSGEGGATHWVELEPGRLDRIRKVGAYEVTIDYVDREASHVHRLALDDHAAYQHWVRTARARLSVDNLGRVRSVARLTDAPAEGEPVASEAVAGTP